MTLYRPDDYLDSHRRSPLGQQRQRQNDVACVPVKKLVWNTGWDPNYPPDYALVSGPAYTDVGYARTFTCVATDPDNDPLTVEYFVNGVSLGVRTTAPYALEWTGNVQGTFTLEAVVTDARGAALKSPAKTIYVGTAAGSVVVSTTTPAVDQIVQISIDISGAGVPTSSDTTIRYYFDGVLAHTSNAPIGDYSFSHAFTEGGPVVITATASLLDGSVFHATEVTIDAQIVVVPNRWFVVDVGPQWLDSGVAIDELQFFDMNDAPIPYTPSNIAVYDEARSGLPSYWNSSIWDKSHLNNNNTAYGGSGATYLLGPSTAGHTGRCRFVVDFGSSKAIKTVRVYNGQTDGSGYRKAKDVKIWATDTDPSDFIAAGNVLNGDFTLARTLTWAATDVVMQESVLAMWDAARVNATAAYLLDNDTIVHTGTGYGGAAALVKIAPGERRIFAMKRIIQNSYGPVWQLGPLSSNLLWTNAPTNINQSRISWAPSINQSTSYAGFGSVAFPVKDTTLDEAFNSGNETTVIIDRSLGEFLIYDLTTLMFKATFNASSFPAEDLMLVFSDGNPGQSIDCQLVNPTQGLV